ncbi:MAG: YeeE/YedE family protein [Burkholderiales bacterium]
MENFTPINALIGGALIGLSATLLLLFNGRIAGISGIFNGLINPPQTDKAWRGLFLAGLILGAGAYVWSQSGGAPVPLALPNSLLLVAGFLVGFGTRMGSGCTSGHGVCGLGRFSIRSLAATLTFMATGFIAVYVVRHNMGIM